MRICFSCLILSWHQNKAYMLLNNRVILNFLETQLDENLLFRIVPTIHQKYVAIFHIYST
jgi:hypothetical protein